jgi:hypothetical protein
MVSMIFGMILKITVGTASVTGTFRPVNFFDIIFGRANGSGGDEAASAAYQSVLTDLTWTGASSSKFLSALYTASPTMLSIRFIVDGFHNDSHLGRVAGTIGPYLAREPMTFTNARFLRPTGNTSQFSPFNFAPAKTDTKRGVITFDLGNAVPTNWPAAHTAPFPVANPLVKLQAALIPASGAPISFGDFDTSEAAYEKTAFVQELPIPNNTANPLASTPTGVLSVETSGRLHQRRSVRLPHESRRHRHGPPLDQRLRKPSLRRTNHHSRRIQRPASAASEHSCRHAHHRHQLSAERHHR